MSLKPREFDSDYVANERAKLQAVHAFQDRPLTSKETLKRIISGPPKTERTLITVDVSMHNEYKMGAEDKIINAALSTDSETVRLLIEHNVKQPTDKAIVLSFHAASTNSEIPDGAAWLRSAVDPLRPTSYTQIYTRESVREQATGDDASSESTSDNADTSGSAGSVDSGIRVGQVTTRRAAIQ
jgi:hypothetical protein